MAETTEVEMESPTSNTALDWIAANQRLITDMSDRLWLYAEPPLLEYRSSAWLVRQLREAGFRVEHGVAGLPTAFVATFGEGGPVIATIAEYETVEDASQMPVPYKQPVTPGLGGCYDMHHGLAAGAVGAAVAASQAMRRFGLRGTLKLFGTPAEKTAIGKNVMGRAGLFDGLDACVSWHPSNETSADRFISQQIRCNNQTAHTFDGISAYNATPWGARNAHHAAELMDVAVQFIKDTIIPVSSLPTISSVLDKRYINHAVSSIPGTARVIYVSRALSRAENELIQKRLFDCANAAAMAVGVQVRNEVITGTWEPLPNLTLARLAHSNIERIGPPAFNASDIQYGQLIQQNLGLSVTDHPFGDMSIVPPGIRPARNVMATTDTTVFCYKCPYAMVTTNYLGEWGLPNWATVSYGLTHIAHAAVLNAARIVACTLVDLLVKPEVLQEAQREFHERLGSRQWYSPMPDEVTPTIPDPLPDEHYRSVIEAVRRGPKWEGWEPELSQRIDRIASDVLSESQQEQKFAHSSS
jgi:aminobenzoyl-glutamate utilization protein B